MFPAFARAAGIDRAKVNFLSVSPELREPMLIQRRADGITGFVTTSTIALKGLGLAPAQQRVMMYADHGLDLYGSALLTTRAFSPWREILAAVTKALKPSLMLGMRQHRKMGRQRRAGWSRCASQKNAP
jgi:NitT/TauT family transport system substrate-binding protein